MNMEHRISKPRKGRWQPAVPELISGAEYCPTAMDECIKMFRLNKKPLRMVMLEASKHLLYLGWKIEFLHDGMIRKRYHAPDGGLYYSFHQVCVMFDHEFDQLSREVEVEVPVSSSEEAILPPVVGKSLASREIFNEACTPCDELVEPEYCPEAVMDYYLLGLQNQKFRRGAGKEAKLKAAKAKKHLSAIGWNCYLQPKGARWELRYCSPTGTVFYSLLTACKWCVQAGALTSNHLSPPIGGMGNVNYVKDLDDNAEDIDKIENLPDESPEVSTSEGLVRSKEREVDKTRMLRKRKEYDKSQRRSCKRVRDKIASSSKQTPRTVLSWLIDNNVILPREKVQYRSGKNGRVKAEGRIAREGIKCSCCGLIFTLSSFEAHAGSTNHRPSANIYLEDGRSLQECQLQLKHRKSQRCSRSEREMKRSQCKMTNDDVCSVCHYGGELVLCDHCPSSFHTRCLGLKEVPDGDWFCPSCCCRICGQGRLAQGNGQVEDSSVLSCSQCEQRYHVECLRNKATTSRYAEGYWFCQDTCEKIFCGLRKILGKKIPVGTQNLTWTLVKYIRPDSPNHDASADEGSVEIYSKLNVALDVMHECFEPSKEPSTGRDVVEDVIFSRWSKLNRLNFQGFYTILLQKNDELISVATVRIYGKAVAEVPLVATRFQYRRLGMCRILMDELEKKLLELGVERLVLPAVPSVLNTWTSSFGFSTVNESERLNFLGYTFLDFQGTVFCQKVLKRSLSVILRPSAGTRAKSCDNVKNDFYNELDESSSVSEVFEGEQVEEIDIVEHESTCKTVAVSETGNGDCSAQTAIVVDQSTLTNCFPFNTKTSVESPVGVVTNDMQSGEGILKCYKRRRISAF